LIGSGLHEFLLDNSQHRREAQTATQEC